MASPLNMKSWIAACVAIVAIVALGLGWRMGYFPQSQGKSLFELEAGTSIAPGKDNTIQRLPGKTAFSVFSTAKAPTSGGTTGGIYISLAPEIEGRASGRKIRVTVKVAPLSNRTSPEFAVAYSTAAVGNSGWHKFKPGAGLETWSFEYAVPKRQEKPGQDYIGIWADTSGSGGGIRIEDIRLEVIEPGKN